MQKNDNNQAGLLSSNSLVAIIGLSLYTVWVLFVCFWIMGFPDSNVGLEVSTIERLGAFIGFPIAYLVLAFLAKNPEFNIFSGKVMITCTAIAAIVPSACAAISFAVGLPTWVSAIALGFGSAAGAFLHVAWLDVLSRFDLSKLGLSIGMSVAAGIAVFALLASMPWYAQDIASTVCVITSSALIAHSSRIAPYNDEKAPLENTADHWEFTREIEPSLFFFGMVFSLSFFFLLGRSPMLLMIGICGLALGAVAVIIADMSKNIFRITSVQRILMVVTVATCVIMTFPNEPLRAVLSVIVTASCSFLVIANSVFLVRKICTPRTVPVFRAIPKRLLIFAIGFALGWLISAVTVMVPGWDPGILKYIRLGAAVVLVAVMMAFLPVEKHHDDTASAAGGKKAYDEDGSEAPQEVSAQAKPSMPIANEKASNGQEGSRVSPVPPYAPPAGVVISESEIFDKKCATIAKLYQLSPREAEILPYLAKGRNNAYLQEKFYISPHTAKSHIYNIYRKLDIHSQQKLMDFVEEFPPDYEI